MTDLNIDLALIRGEGQVIEVEGHVLKVQQKESWLCAMVGCLNKDGRLWQLAEVNMQKRRVFSVNMHFTETSHLRALADLIDAINQALETEKQEATQ